MLEIFFRSERRFRARNIVFFGFGARDTESEDQQLRFESLGLFVLYPLVLFGGESWNGSILR